MSDSWHLACASVATLFFVTPTMYHLIQDGRTKSTRSFSICPHRIRNAIATVFRFALIASVPRVAATNLLGDFSGYAWIGAIVILIASMAVMRGDHRFTIDAATGLVKWRKMSIPWPQSRLKTVFVDDLSPLRFERDKRQKRNYLGEYFELWGLATVWLKYSVNYNGGTQTGGQYSDHTVSEMCDRINEYLGLFAKHDTKERKTERSRFREQYEASRVPDLEEERATMIASEREDAEEAARIEERRREAERKEQARREKLENKFR